MDFQKTLARLIEDAQRMWEFRLGGTPVCVADRDSAAAYVTVRRLPDRSTKLRRAFTSMPRAC